MLYSYTTLKYKGHGDVKSVRTLDVPLFIYFPTPPIIFALLLSLSPYLDVTQISYRASRKQALFFSPRPHNSTCLQFYREKTSALSSLFVASHPIAPIPTTHAAGCSQRLISLSFFF